MGNAPRTISSNRSTAATFALIALLSQRTILHRRGNVVRRIAGPPSPSWIFGNMLQLLLPYQYGDHEFGWQELYGALYRIKGCFGEDRLIISDPVALQFIITNIHKFEHSPMLTYLMGLVYDKMSIVGVKGQDEHRRLRAAFNPGFSAAGVRGYQSVMQNAAQEITKSLDLDGASTESVDLWPLLSTATLSSISQAVLGCKTEELGDELVETTTRMVMLASVINKGIIVGGALANLLPIWALKLAMSKLIPSVTLTELRKGQLLSKQIGRRLVEEKLAAARQGLEPHNDVFSQIHKTQTLTEGELEVQTSLMIIGGQETTANTLAFGLTELARHPGFQDDLRREIHASRLGGDGEHAHNNMPLLNAFIKEILRLYPILPNEERIAGEDTVIPLMQSITTSTGERLSEVPVRKGQIIFLGIAAYQRLESIWGADAAEFKPSRWIGGTNQNVHRGPAIGPYANLLAFFGGSHTCLGWRFAILEMQVIICELVGKFSFALAEGEVARMNGASVVQPIISDGNKAAPLRVTRVV